MGDVVRFRSGAGVEGEHPAIRVLRERMGAMEPAEAYALDSLAESPHEDVGSVIASEIFKVAGNQALNAEQLRGWVFGVFLWKLFARK